MNHPNRHQLQKRPKALTSPPLFCDHNAGLRTSSSLSPLYATIRRAGLVDGDDLFGLDDGAGTCGYSSTLGDHTRTSLTYYGLTDEKSSISRST